MTTTAARPQTPDAGELDAAYCDGDRAARHPAPLLRERQLAWDLSACEAVNLRKPGAPLRARMRAERDFLDGYLEPRRREMSARVVDEFQGAIDALTAGVNALDAAASVREQWRAR